MTQTYGESSGGGTALCLNEDDSHFFSSRAGTRPGLAEVNGWVDQYAGTQVRELMLCPNAMRTSYASEVWDPIWRGYDPDGPDDQPLLASLPPEGRTAARRWIHTAWQLHHDGLDLYALWIARARECGLRPWLSMRMNDVHNVDDEQSFIHSEFWRASPHLRRVPYRFASWMDRAFDYGQAEVRDYHLKLIGELLARYDLDGLELDWMRFGWHLRPGHEAEGADLLTAFTSQVRRLLDAAEQKRGHAIALGARVPSRPQTALGLGLDAMTWAERGLLDMLVVTPFFATVEPDMPLELWRHLLRGTGTSLAAGLEILLQPYPGWQAARDGIFPAQTNSLETVRGAAVSLLDRGADRIYLFNYMDSETAMADLGDYPALLREVGSLETLSGKPRRHVLTYADTWALGEPAARPLPVQCRPGQWEAFRLPLGPRPTAGRAQVRLAAEGDCGTCGCVAVAGAEVRLNGELCSSAEPAKVPPPGPLTPLAVFEIPLPAMTRGYNVIELLPACAARLDWVEIAVQPASE